MGQKYAKTELFAQWLKGSMVIADQGVSTGARCWVDSTTGTDGTAYGRNPETPVATLDYAISNLCTANKGDIIYVMPGHSEALTASNLVDVDIDGVTVSGLYELIENALEDE